MIAFFGFLFFIIGMLSYFYSPFLFLLTLIPLFYLLLYKKKKKAWLYLLFTLAGYVLLWVYPMGREGITTLDGICVYRKENYCLIFSLSGKYYVIDKENMIPLFSFVHLTGKSKNLLFTHYESVFNFKDYLKTQGVFYEFQIKDISVSFRNPISSAPIKNYLFACLDEKPKIFISSLLVGDSLYDLEEHSFLNELGLQSYLSLSGFHLSFFFALIESFLKKNQKEKWHIIELMLLLFFLFLSDYRYSLQRIFLTKLISYFTHKKKLKISRTDILSFVAILLLCKEPYSLLSPSFYFPFPFLITNSLVGFRRKNNLRSKVKFFITILLFYFPIKLIQQPYFNILSPFLQMLIIPFSHLLFCASFILFILPPFGYVLNALVNGILFLVPYLNVSPLTLITGTPSILFFIFYYLVFMILLVLQQYHFTNQVKLAYLSLSLLLSSCAIPDLFPHYEVTFIDVGQGDCTLIRYGHLNMLIDTGGSLSLDIAKECLLPYFYKHKITSLDSITITHPDYDHNGALNSLLSSFNVGHVYTTKDYNQNQYQTMYFGEFSISNLNTYLKVGDSSDDNYNSGVYRFTIRSHTFLIMGDAPKEIEEKLLDNHKNIDCDVLKIGHHGSNTSSSESFLKACSPNVAIISCGEKNKYGHPHKEVLNTLNKLNIPYRRTDLEGSITYYC